MSTETAFKFVTEILSSYAGMQASAITPEMDLRTDLGLDSVDASSLIINVEERLGVRLDLEGFQEIETVDGVVARLAKVLDEGRLVKDVT